MSMCICNSCSRPIDSDDDPDCFIDTSPTTTACLCERCREENEEETESAPGRDSRRRAVKGQEPEVHRAVPTLDPRDPDYSRVGIFVTHNCSRCSDGALPCKFGNPNRCEYPHARND